MEINDTHNTSIVGITGENNKKLHALANLYYEPIDPESILSVIVSLEHKPEVRWNTLHTIEQWCTSMDQSEGGSLFVVTMEGELHFYKEVWNVINLDCPDGLNSVWAASDNEAFIVGLSGERIRVIGEKVEIIREPSESRLNAVHGSSSSNVIAVGDAGIVFNYDGKKWNRIDLPTNVNLLAVYCRSKNEILIGGVGVLYRWDGVVWHEIEAEQLNISSIAYYQNNFFIACGKNGVFVLNNDTLESFKKELTVYRLNRIGSSLFGIGNKLVAQFDGQDWWGGNLDL